jgi:hypothetical protein
LFPYKKLFRLPTNISASEQGKPFRDKELRDGNVNVVEPDGHPKSFVLRILSKFPPAT